MKNYYMWIDLAVIGTPVLVILGFLALKPIADWVHGEKDDA